LDAVDRVIWILPFLALLDVISTFYTASLRPLANYNWELFANLFLGAGSIYVYPYAIIYLAIVVGVAYALLYIKNRKLRPSHTPDKVIFLVLVGVIFYIYMRLTAAFLMNFFLPTIIERGINMSELVLVIYVGSALSLGFYLWGTVLSWVRRIESEKKE
jgi:hypothetical protein